MVLFFNEFKMIEFTKEDFVSALQNYVLMSGEDVSVALRSLNDDFTCIVNTYLPRYKSNPGKISPENNIDCPFGELGFIDILSKENALTKNQYRWQRALVRGLFWRLLWTKLLTEKKSH